MTDIWLSYVRRVTFFCDIV